MIEKVTITGMIMLCTCIVFSSSVLANVQISQVLYDPIGTESGGEAVELYNPTSEPIDISGYILQTESSSTDAIIPQNTVMQPNSYFLVADVGFSENKDDPSWPDADYEEPITLTNSNAGVALANAESNRIDAVGWGDPLAIDDGLFEGDPAEKTSPGESLVRVQDTNNNRNDFVQKSPEWNSAKSNSGVFNSVTSSVIEFTISVSSSISKIIAVAIGDDDTLKEGTQIVPIPKSEVKKQLNLTLHNDQGTEYIGNVSIAFMNQTYELIHEKNLNTTDAIYSANISVDFFESPGNYSLVAEAENSNASLEIEIMPVLGFEIDVEALSCTLKTGESCVVSGDATMNTSNKTTVRNIGNIPLNLELSSESPSDLRIEYWFEGFSPQPLLTVPVDHNIGLSPGVMATTPLNFQLFVPNNVSSGNYSVNIVVTGK